MERRIQYKINTICYNVSTGTAPPYLFDHLELYTPSRTLRSSADIRIFRIPNRRKRFQGQRASSFIPFIWNNLPFSVRHAQTLSAIISQLKTHLSLSPTPVDLSSLEHALSNLGNMWACMCACVRACVCVRVCVKVEGE